MDVVTPINADRLERLLHEAGYNWEKSQYLIDGFRFGFDFGYWGPHQHAD